MAEQGEGGNAARGQIYMGAPIGVVEIHLQLGIAAPVNVPTLFPLAPPLEWRNGVRWAEAGKTVIESLSPEDRCIGL